MEEALSQKRFLWGLLLAWLPWIPTMIGIGYLFIGISNSKATGLAVVAGVMAELLVLWGLLAICISQTVAIVWLFRSFSSAHILRGLMAAASILASGLTLFLVCAFLFWGRGLLEQVPAR